MKSKSQKFLKKKRVNIKCKEQYPDIINNKARNLSRALKWGKGSTKIIREMLTEALDKPCHWCQTKLTIDNIQLDHKNPILRTIERTDHQLNNLNRPKNIRFICKTCNLTKGTIPEIEFQKLTDFLNKNKRLRGYIKNALYYYNTRYSEFANIYRQMMID